MTNPEDNAFPWNDVGPHAGLTKREYFAAMAMQGIVASEGEGFTHPSRESLVMSAVKYADALIAELNKDSK